MNNEEFVELIEKQRDEPILHLHFQPSVELLINSHHCNSIERVFQRGGVKWEKRKAVESLGNSLPDSTGLYMFVWKPEFSLQFDNGDSERFSWVLYVGKAGIEAGKRDTIKSRFLGEYSKYVGKDASCLWDTRLPDKREARLARFLTLRPLWYWFLLLDNMADISLLERRLLKLFRPPLNDHHVGPRLRPGKAEPAF